MSISRAWEVGTKLPDLVCGPTSRTTLALYAGASSDHNPIHIDIDFARQSGFSDVLSHGMLSMAYLGRLLTGSVPQERLRSFNARFVSITPVNATVMCSGEVVEIFEVDGERRARVAVGARVEGGDTSIIGEAVVAID